MTALPKAQPQEPAFTRAMKDWLSGNVTGHLGSYMYTDDEDDHRWKSGHSAAAYYVGRDEKAVLDVVLREIGITVDNFVDLGPGGEASVHAKSLPMMRAIKAKAYYTIDLSPALAQDALDLAKKELDVGGRPIVADFFDRIPLTKTSALLAIMGATIGNFETHTDLRALQNRLTNIFSGYRKAAPYHSFFLVSFDANTNGQEIRACYENAEFGELVRSCVARAIDISGFAYDVTWTPENYQLATGLRSTRDQMVSLDGEQFAIEQGEFLPVLNSYRFPVPFVLEAARRAGWTHRKTWSATGRLHYILFGKAQHTGGPT
jgi:uncharacterized SAM-dependent methyltransferase